MVGYVRWEEKRKRLTLRRCPLGDGEVCLLEGGGRLDRRVQRRVRQAAQAMADAGVRYAAAPPEWAALLLPLRLPARRVRYLSPQLGRGQEELRRSLRHRYGLGEGGPAAQLAVCFGAAAEGLPSLLIGESHQEVRYVWAEPWWEKMKPWAAEEPLLAALLAEGSLPPGAAVPVWVGLDTGGERTYNAE